MTFSATDHLHMAHALRLAERGMYTTQPNPRVGCVIAHGDEIVGAGFHQRAGEPHAEVFALREAEERARGATAYVTLEPCAHYGRTPPCAQALISAGVVRVVAATQDPNPQVAGRGLEMLRAAGIVVETGLMRDAARELNPGFFSRIERGRPWLRVKLAMSLDGRTALANGESKWITSDAARADVQRWRARSSAILTGSGTVLTDNPHLTVRVPLSSLSPGKAEGQRTHLPLTSQSPVAADGERVHLRVTPQSPDAADGEKVHLPVTPQSPSAADGGKVHLPVTPQSPVAAEGTDRPMPLSSLSPGAAGGEGWGEGAALAPDAADRSPVPPSIAIATTIAPLRVVLDRRLRTPADSHILDGTVPTLIVHAADAAMADRRFAHVELAVIADTNGALDLPAVLALLAARDCNEVQVEAGPTLCGALFAAGLVDELLLYVAPLLLGDSARPLLQLPTLDDMAQRWQLRVVEQRQVGCDWRLRLRPS